MLGSCSKSLDKESSTGRDLTFYVFFLEGCYWFESLVWLNLKTGN